jgi:hypothetical protein
MEVFEASTSPLDILAVPDDTHVHDTSTAM